MAKLRHFDGSPVAEGVRVEVGKYTIFAVRNTQRDIAVRQRKEPRRILRVLMHIPFARGIARLLRDIIRFFDGLAECRELLPLRPVHGTKVEQSIAAALHVPAQSVVTLISFILMPIIAFLGLYAAPIGAEEALKTYCTLSTLQLGLVMSLIRSICLLVSIWAVTHLRVFNRLLMYKGAFNKTLNCYECRDDVIPENAKQYPRCARRSEAAFLISVLIISLFAFPFIKSGGIAVYAITRLAIIFVVAAIWNEPYSALEAAELTGIVRVMRAPFDALQMMTTIEPDRRVLEVAVCAFQAALGEIEEVKEDDDSGMAEEG